MKKYKLKKEIKIGGVLLMTVLLSMNHAALTIDFIIEVIIKSILLYEVMLYTPEMIKETIKFFKEN